MKAIAVGLSEVGRLRERNEDDFLLLPEHGVFVAAKGMGGDSLLSNAATKKIAEFFGATDDENRSVSPFSTDASKLVMCVAQANQTILELKGTRPHLYASGVGLVALHYLPKVNQMYIVHVGTSRCLRVRAGKIEQLTRDHSLFNELDQQSADLREALLQQGIPDGIPTRALGMEKLQVDNAKLDIPELGDCYVLCTDGVYGLVTDEEIADIVNSSLDLSAAAQQIVDRAKQLGSEQNADVFVQNTTFVLVRLVEDFAWDSSGLDDETLTAAADATPDVSDNGRQPYLTILSGVRALACPFAIVKSSYPKCSRRPTRLTQLEDTRYRNPHFR